MTVKELINKLLDYDMDMEVELLTDSEREDDDGFLGFKIEDIRPLAKEPHIYFIDWRFKENDKCKLYPYDSENGRLYRYEDGKMKEVKKNDEWENAEKYIKPRLQGHWEIYTDMNADKTCTCSNCNRYIVYFREHDKPFDYDYCPYCGSYMKEETQNDNR